MKLRSQVLRGLIGLLLLSLALGASLGEPQSRLSAPDASLDWNYIAGLPREEAIALAFLDEYTQYRSDILNLVFRMWAEEDPVAAHNHLLSLSNDFEKSPIETQIIEKWLSLDPRSAIAAAVNAENRQTFELVLRTYAHRDPEDALEAAMQFGARVGKAEWIGIIEGVASTNPRLAAQTVASFGEGGAYLIGAFIYALALENPGNAIDWLLRYFPDNVAYYESIASIFYVRGPDAAFAYLEQMVDGVAREKFREGLVRARSVNE